MQIGTESPNSAELWLKLNRELCNVQSIAYKRSVYQTVEGELSGRNSIKSSPIASSVTKGFGIVPQTS